MGEIFGIFELMQRPDGLLDLLHYWRSRLQVGTFLFTVKVWPLLNIIGPSLIGIGAVVYRIIFGELYLDSYTKLKQPLGYRLQYKFRCGSHFSLVSNAPSSTWSVA